MNIHYITEPNEDFEALCMLLDTSLEEVVAGEFDRTPYRQFNTLEKIHDICIAYDGETPAGCASFREYEPGTAEVKRVFVRKEYRGRGISRLLMEALEKKARERGFHTLILECGEPLTAAMELYRKTGFEITGNYAPYIGMADSICMRKKL